MDHSSVLGGDQHYRVVTDDISALRKNIGRGIIVLGSLALVLYNWNNLTDMLGDPVGWILPVGVAAGLVVAIRLIPRPGALLAVALAFATGAYIVAVPSIATWVSGEPAPAIAFDVVALDTAYRPDVFVIVLDGYGSADVLAIAEVVSSAESSASALRRTDAKIGRRLCALLDRQEAA